MRAILASLLLLVLPFPSFASTEHSKFTKHYDDSIFKVTEKGLFSLEIIIKDKGFTVGQNAIDIIAHDKGDRDLVGAVITVTPWMPEMGHGVREKAVVVEKGGGLYRAENIVLNMGGFWELRIVVKKDKAEDSAVFEFRDIQSGHGQQMPGHSPSGMDMSRTRLSDKKMFKVSYESQITPLVVNELHSVKLRITTADDTPVTGAEISISGDMPAHGHGLPTEPEVTEELGDGYYLVEGVKFSMPGLWLIVIEIKAGDMTDGVSFNLNLQ